VQCLLYVLEIRNRNVWCCKVVDANLPFVSEQFINNAIVMVVTLCIIASVFPYFLLAMLPVLILFGVLFSICQKGIRAAKRYISLMELWIVMWFYSS